MTEPSENLKAARRINFRQELNEPQFRAVSAPPGDALVLAGAGSGKTRTLIYRVAWLLETGVSPYAILLLTFTNKAAREMLERVHELVGLETRDLWGGTFHSICAKILRIYGGRGGIERNFTVLDREDQVQLLRAICQEIGGNAGERDAKVKIPKPEVLASVLSFVANTQRSLEDVLETDFAQLREHKEKLEMIGCEYQERKIDRNLFDFDDLLTRCLSFLREVPEVADTLRQRFEHVLVDEYQDTNTLQAELIREITGGRSHLMVVGDDAQGIYSWRGANHRNILDFRSGYPQSQLHTIEINYRSTPEILSVANHSIAKNSTNFPKALTAARSLSGSLPEFHTVRRTSDEASFVAEKIFRLINEGVEPGQIATLYRAHYQSMELQLELSTRSVPFQIMSGLRFFEQAHIKDLSAFLRFVCNPRDEISFRRMIKNLEGVGPVSIGNMWRGWLEKLEATGGKTLEKFSFIFESIPVPTKAKKDWFQIGYVLDEMVDEHGSAEPAVMLRSVMEGIYEDRMKLEFSNFQSRVEDIEKFMEFARRYEKAEEFLEDLALLSTVDTDPRRDKKSDNMVTLSSIHQAKGLEWAHVFVIGLADGAFPSRRVVESGSLESLEEERRLFYVAITRAMDRLTMTYPAMTTTAWSGDTWNPPSRFLTELDPTLITVLQHR